MFNITKNCLRKVLYTNLLLFVVMVLIPVGHLYLSRTPQIFYSLPYYLLGLIIIANVYFVIALISHFLKYTPIWQQIISLIIAIVCGSFTALFYLVEMTRSY